MDNPIYYAYIQINKNPKGQLQMDIVRRKIKDVNLIRAFVSALYQEKPVLLLPTSRNRLEFMNSLIQNGVVKLDKENNKYYLLI
jgi:hypothetical protein